MIDYRKKIKCDRKYEKSECNDIDGATESNRGRIINSPAVRRLQQKTQVFPLEINAAVRSRLTHSLEVQQNARYIARSILKIIKENEKLEEFKLNDLEHAFVSTSEMASLMHDIGNPPFGHFGELAFNEWMKEEGIQCFNQALNIKSNKYLTKSINSLKIKLEKDICNFEGNAQGIRIVHSLQNLNLSYTQIASILKYTRVAYEDKPIDGNFTYLKKKPGFYFSEEDFVKELCDNLEIEEGCRFPLTYIMEAADDIAYGIADLEDSVDKGIMSLKKLYETICNEADNHLHGKYIKEIATKYYEKSKGQKYMAVNSFIIDFRVALTNDLVKYAAQIFIDNHEEIFYGRYNKALLEKNESEYDDALDVLKNVARKYVFNHPDVEILELKGNTAIKGLLNHYKSLLKLSIEEFDLLLNNEKNNKDIEARLFRRLSNKHLHAYVKALNKLKEKSLIDLEYKVYEWYYRARLILDFISGMTDEYALKEYQTLSAI
jgi:dGTPase